MSDAMSHGSSFKDSKTCLKQSLKKAQNIFLRPITAECRSKVLQDSRKSKVLQNKILLTLTKLLRVFKTFILSIFEWLLKTGVTVMKIC